MLLPAIQIHAEDVRDIADLMALGTSSISDISRKQRLEAQIKSVASALANLNQLGEDYNKEEVEIAKRVDAAFIKNAEKSATEDEATISRLGELRHEMLVKTQAFKRYWGANDKLKIECERLVALERFSYTGEAIDQDTKDQLYSDFIEEEAGRISGISELNGGQVKIKKMLGRDRQFAINAADTTFAFILNFIKIAQADNFAKKKYNNHDLEELAENEDADDLYWLHLPRNYIFEIEISNQLEADALLNRLGLVRNLSTRAKVIAFRKALEEKRPLDFFLQACDERSQFSYGELDTVLQSIARFNARINKRMALRSGK